MSSFSDLQKDADKVRRKTASPEVKGLIKIVDELCRLGEEQEERIKKLENGNNSD